MPHYSQKRTSAKFYQQDIVQRIAAPHQHGVVLRCWHDAEEVPPNIPLTDPLLRPLEPGEVGVSFLAEGSERMILLEADLQLVDRFLQPGDLCKKSIDDVRSGVVTKIHVKAKLEHAISGEAVDGWKTLDDLQMSKEAEIGDYVVYDDWLGQVMELYDESLIEMSSGHLVRLPELSARLVVGEKGNDIIPPPVSGVHNLFGLFSGQSRPGAFDTVLAVRHTVYAVAWLAVNQSLPPAEAEKRRRPQRFWYGEDLGKLTLLRGRSDIEMHVGDRVFLKQRIGVPMTQHGSPAEPAGIINVAAFLVAETQTTLTVLWQDGEEETLRATKVIPYLNPDEYDCWPGDHVIWKNEDSNRTAIVQSVSAVDRTAKIHFSSSNTTELVSVLELDTHGTAGTANTIPQSVEGLGVRRGDFVFIHPEGTTNGFDSPNVPRIGEVEAWVRDGPSVVAGELSGWRKEMSEIGMQIAKAPNRVKELDIKLYDPDISWIGEVTNVHLDGSVEVTLANLVVATYLLCRLTKLYDVIEQLEDDIWGEGASEGPDSSQEDEQVWAMSEDGVWQPDASNSDEWEEVDDSDWEDEARPPPMEVDSDVWPDEIITTESIPPISVPALLSESDTPIEPSPTLEDRPSIDSRSPLGELGDGEPPFKRFDIIPSAPPDHAFFSSAPAQPSKSFLGRLTREYRILASSLPETIIVRAFEDRTDLLRSLIIGPQNTPYEDAPFVIDWMLDSNFPQSPPIAHFLSWTNGNGRVNPNLYEEGKVCLSILGTWAGDANEVWSPSRSSLLQALVSIQGLVLVREPWFCEPAYEKLRGTEDAIVNSRLYSEKAYVLSRGFVRRALEIPLGGLEDEISWIYYDNGRLNKVLQGSRALIDKSRSEKGPSTTTMTAAVDGAERQRQRQQQQQIDDDMEDLAVPRLTMGGIISLERTLIKLQGLADKATAAKS